MVRRESMTRFEDLVTPKPIGEPINAHVVENVKEPTPDFDKMQRIIQSDNTGRAEDTVDTDRRINKL